MHTSKAFVLSALLAFSLPVSADDERPEHFKGKPAETVEQALANFSEYNDKLAQILAKDKLTPKDHYEIHQLTYTLENALEKIREEYEELAETLETVHLASEENDEATVRSNGQQYLETSEKLLDRESE